MSQTIANLNPNKVLIIGASGSGKSYGMRHLPPSMTVVICPDQKALPFRGFGTKYKQQVIGPNNPPNKGNFFATTDPTQVLQIMKFVNDQRPEIKFLVVDTVTAMLLNDVMYKTAVSGWDKWNDLAVNAWDIIRAPDGYREDLFVYINAHTDPVMAEIGKSEFFVPGGKIMKQKMRPEIYFTTVLETEVEVMGNDIDYYFCTQNNGHNMAKSPPSLFGGKRLIPNDLMLVAKAMRAYNEDRDFDLDAEIEFLKTVPDMPDSIPIMPSKSKK